MRYVIVSSRPLQNSLIQNMELHNYFLNSNSLYENTHANTNTDRKTIIRLTMGILAKINELKISQLNAKKNSISNFFVDNLFNTQPPTGAPKATMGAQIHQLPNTNSETLCIGITNTMVITEFIAINATVVGVAFLALLPNKKTKRKNKATSAPLPIFATIRPPTKLNRFATTNSQCLLETITCISEFSFLAKKYRKAVKIINSVKRNLTVSSAIFRYSLPRYIPNILPGKEIKISFQSIHIFLLIKNSVAKVIPTDCIINEKVRASATGMSRNFVNTGKATAPPPKGVEPAKKEPKTIVRPLDQYFI